MTELAVTSHNFPKLKELYASHNHFIAAKHFLKLDSLKLLDLSYNRISHIEDLVCLAFHNGLVVLNLLHNPVHQNNGTGWEETIK